VAIGPLEGVRVLAIEQLLSAPFGTQILADLGAEVVSVDGIDEPQIETWAPWRLRTGRHKKSVLVNLRDENGQELVRRLAGKADAVIENCGAGVADAYGLGYRQLCEVNPRLVYVSVSGFGLGNLLPGNLSTSVADGSLAEAFGGLTDVLLKLGATGPLTAAVGEAAASMFAIVGLLSAMYSPDESVTGRHVDVAEADAMLAITELPFVKMSLALAGIPPSPSIGGALDGVFRTLDGRFNLVVLNRRHWEALAEILDHPDWLAQSWFNDAELRATAFERVIFPPIREWAKTRSLKEVLERFRSAGLAVSPVMRPAEILADPHYLARRMIATIEQPDGTLISVPGNPIKMSSADEDAKADLKPVRIAQPGEHTYSVLREWLQMTDGELHALSQSGAIESPVAAQGGDSLGHG
jgi:crotonobetainyl-CoA:carnitine CoA-transferase CaiB-like acyl-CoA transferase